MCRALKAPSLAASWQRLAERARTEGWTHEEYLAVLNGDRLRRSTEAISRSDTGEVVLMCPPFTAGPFREPLPRRCQRWCFQRPAHDREIRGRFLGGGHDAVSPSWS